MKQTNKAYAPSKVYFHTQRKPSNLFEIRSVYHTKICLDHAFSLSLLRFGSVQFSSIQGGICALGKAHIMCSAPSLRSIPSVAVETVPTYVGLHFHHVSLLRVSVNIYTWQLCYPRCVVVIFVQAMVL